MLVELDNNRKVVLLEADGQNYPGMFVQPNLTTQFGIKATFAPFPVGRRWAPEQAELYGEEKSGLRSPGEWYY
jgi:hypothetical protein